jgi:adenylate cyclase class IV
VVGRERRGQAPRRGARFLVGRTRIQLDRVEGLGSFVELEVVLGPGEAEEVGAREGERLLAALGIAAAPRIAGSYADL